MLFPQFLTLSKLFYLVYTKFLFECWKHLEQLLETDFWLQLNSDLVQIINEMVENILGLAGD